MRLVVVTPHFAPDVAPTGDVATRLVQELAARGHTLEVVTSLPWYRDHAIEPGWDGRLVRHEDTPWGRITRLHPFPAADKRSLPRRAAAFMGFSMLVAGAGARGPRADGVLALSPPLTLGVAGWLVAGRRRAPFVFNVQDVFPDIAIELGAIKEGRIAAAARRLERFCYGRAQAVTVLSHELADNVRAKCTDPSKVHVLPNFVDVDAIRPGRKQNPYRREFGLADKTVVMYAGNVGLSQSLELAVSAAAALAHYDDLVFVINGGGAALMDLKARARGLSNMVFVDPQPAERLPQVLAAADVHLVMLKPGLARLSVPSKLYSILAAARPVIASVDPSTEVTRVLREAGAGVAVPPGDAEALTKAVVAALDAPQEWARMGRSGRRWVEHHASPEAVAAAYEDLFVSLTREG